MTDDLWLRLADLVPDALDLPPDERAAFLDDACRTPTGEIDPDLRREAESLVAAAEEAEATGALRTRLPSLVGEVAYATGMSAHAPPETVGPWRVTGVLGEGGQGVVYRAVRADGAFEREVALKLLRPGAALGAGGARLAARLTEERRVLARLEHDGIARLYDGGLDDDGRPYLALELIDGAPITEAAATMTLRERVALLAAVCRAVAFAHARLVVHRDLKPSNVLVTPDGRPKLLDFGVARLLGGARDPDLTVAGWMTPTYAAPEQVRGRDVTTATDVYALGVLAYEVLAGARPYDLAGLAPSAVERLVCRETPPLPSARASPEAGRVLRGDLDTIVMKALEKDPVRRYTTAQALADDLGRWLDGLPIEARAATVRYRVGRFARRHQASVVGGVAALVAVVAVSAIAFVRVATERDRAEARFDIAREAALSMLYDVHDEIAGLPGATAARASIAERARATLDQLAADASADAALRVELAGAYLRLGRVQGDGTTNNLGLSDDARDSFRRGIALLAGLGPLPDSLAAQSARTETWLFGKLAGVVAHTVSPDSALALYRRSEIAGRRAIQLDPAHPDVRIDLSTSIVSRGDHTGHPYFPNVGDPEGALAAYADALEVILSVPEAERSLYGLRMEGNVYERQGTILRDLGRLGEAAAPTRRALALRRRVAARPDANVDAQRDLGIAYDAVGLLAMERGRFEEAERSLLRYLQIAREIAAADPASVHALSGPAHADFHLAQLYATPGMDRPALARRHAASALSTFRALRARDPENAKRQNEVELVEQFLAAL